MSYMMFQQKCADCGAEWNAAFGIVGMTPIAAPPKACPKCQSPKIERLADGWKMNDGSIHPKPPAAPAPVTEPPHEWVGGEFDASCCAKCGRHYSDPVHNQSSPPAQGERGETDTPWRVGEWVEGKGYAIHKARTDFGMHVIVGYVGWRRTADRIVEAVNFLAESRR